MKNRNLPSVFAVLISLVSLICADTMDSALSAYDSLTSGKIIRYSELVTRMEQLPRENPLFGVKQDTAFLKCHFVKMKSRESFAEFWFGGGTLNLARANGELIQQGFDLRKVSVQQFNVSESEKSEFLAIQEAMRVPEIGLMITSTVFYSTVVVAGMGSLIYAISDMSTSGSGKVDRDFLGRCALVGSFSLTGSFVFGAQYFKKAKRVSSMIVQSGRRDFETFWKARSLE